MTIDLTMDERRQPVVDEIQRLASEAATPLCALFDYCMKQRRYFHVDDLYKGDGIEALWPEVRRVAELLGMEFVEEETEEDEDD